MALFLGILIPLLFILVIFFISNSIQNSEDISKLTQIPLLGVIGLNKDSSNLAVFEKPKSALSEAFRGIRSSLQFLYKNSKLAEQKH